MGGRCAGVVVGAVLTVVLGGCANPAPPPEAKPLPVGAAASGAAQYRAAAKVFYQRVLSDAYAANGDRTAAGHSAGTAYVEAWTAHVLDHDVYRLAVAVDRAMKPLLSQNVADPLLCLLVGLRLQEREHPGAARWLKRAVDGLSGSRYPPQVMCLAPAALLKEARRGRASGVVVSQQELTRARDQLVLAAAQQPADRPVEQRLVVQLLNEASDGGAGPRGEVLAALTRSPRCDRWLRRYYRGLSEIELAWRAGGPVPAGQQKREAVGEFVRHMRVARCELEAAWREHPELPEAPTAMIEVARAGCAGRYATPRTWFDRAVAGQCDYAPAYQQLSQALLPRWGGAVEQVLALGHECIATARFDGAMPRHGLRAVQAAAGDGGDASVWRRAEVRRDLEALFAGLMAEVQAAVARDGDRAVWRQPNLQGDLDGLLQSLARGAVEPTERAGWQTVQAVAWLRMGRHGQALARLKLLGGLADLDFAAAGLGADADLLRSELRAQRAPEAKATRQAEEAALRGDVAAAQAGFEAVLAAVAARREKATARKDLAAVAAAEAVMPWLQTRLDELATGSATGA